MDEVFNIVASLKKSEQERVARLKMHFAKKLDITHYSSTSLVRAALLALEEKEGLVAERFTDAI